MPWAANGSPSRRLLRARPKRNRFWKNPSSKKKPGWFVKPNRLGAKIGIWPDSHCDAPDKALELSRRVFDAYRDAVVVQPYVPGRNVRASFLAVRPDTGPEALGIFFVEFGRRLPDHGRFDGALRRYRRGRDRFGPLCRTDLVAVADSQPHAAGKIRAIAARLMQALGLTDVFSMDFRVEADNTVHLIEFEVGPGLPCFDFRAYCGSQWGLGLAEAMAETAANRFSNRLG